MARNNPNYLALIVLLGPPSLGISCRSARKVCFGNRFLLSDPLLVRQCIGGCVQTFGFIAPVLFNAEVPVRVPSLLAHTLLDFPFQIYPSAALEKNSVMHIGQRHPVMFDRHTSHDIHDFSFPVLVQVGHHFGFGRSAAGGQQQGLLE